MSKIHSSALFDFWRKHNTAPYHFPMTEEMWADSMYFDKDNDGRTLFSDLKTDYTEQYGRCTAMIQYGRTAFGFDDSGEFSEKVHYPVIRCLCFNDPTDGQTLLRTALDNLGSDERVYAFFHYFGMSACGRHGKLHENQKQVESLLLSNNFIIEHENLYYTRTLTDRDAATTGVTLSWRDLSAGGCREFAALHDGKEIGWGQVHFLPQGNIAYLRWIYIDGGRQHQGFGTATMQTLFSELYRMGIRRFDTDTAINNVIAQHYYEKNGFSNAGITRSYYTK